MLFYLLLIAALPFHVIAYQQDSDDSSVEMAEQDGMAFQMASEKFNTERRFRSIPLWLYDWEILFYKCMANCSMPNDNNPVCGTDGINYVTRSVLRCAQKCGKNVQIRHRGFCIYEEILASYD